MQEYKDVSSLITQVRAGDSRAAEELVRRYEHELQAEIRQHLRRGRIRRLIDSQDICQSVFASFFIRLSLGEYDLNSSEDLVKLLMRMVRNKTYAQMRRQFAERRDIRRTSLLVDEQGGEPLVDGAKTPSQKMAIKELLASAMSRLSESERNLAEQRTAGQSWDQIASASGEKPDTVRKRLERAIKRVRREMTDIF